MTNPTPRQVLRFGRAAEEDTKELIRHRAYDLYEARGRGDGHDVEDWLAAETEIVGRSESAAA